MVTPTGLLVGAVSSMAYDREFTPQYITKLEPNEIFVFGSNLQGFHGGGAAALAHRCFGAVWGQGEGLQGQSYALPTMFADPNDMQPYVAKLILCAQAHPEFKFYVTEVGCGIAGFTVAQIAPLFVSALDKPNIILPESFVAILSHL